MGISEWTADNIGGTKPTRKKKLSPPTLPLQEPYIWDDVAAPSSHGYFSLFTFVSLFFYWFVASMFRWRWFLFGLILMVHALPSDYYKHLLCYDRYKAKAEMDILVLSYIKLISF